MKTIKRKDGRIWRVTDKEAAHLVKTTGAVYIPKGEYKVQEDDKS